MAQFLGGSAVLSNGVTFYPGIGADEEIEKLERLIGKITAFWAQVEDSLFNLFVVAIAGTWPNEIRPYRAVFFTFSAYEGKMRMLNNAMKARFGDNKEIAEEWRELKKVLDDTAKLRNEIAHLVPAAKGSRDKDAKADVRLVPPLSTFQERDFDKLGYSWDQLTQALAPFWSFDPGLNIWDTSHTMLGYRVQEFVRRLPQKSAQPAHPSNP